MSSFLSMEGLSYPIVKRERRHMLGTAAVYCSSNSMKVSSLFGVLAPRKLLDTVIGHPPSVRSSVIF